MFKKTMVKNNGLLDGLFKQKKHKNPNDLANQIELKRRAKSTGIQKPAPNECLQIAPDILNFMVNNLE